MKKDINNILKVVTPDTPLEELLTYCDDVEDFELILSSLTKMDSKPVRLSEEIQKAALSLVKENKLEATQITASYIQRNLPVTYPQASEIIDFLKSRFE